MAWKKICFCFDCKTIYAHWFLFTVGFSSYDYRFKLEKTSLLANKFVFW